MFEISTHSQREEEIERREEEREGFPIPKFSPLCLRIVRMLAG